ncbi:MAG TPA: VanZ family protein [Usitatibacter sp.]|nr:VanZ family protein [Usitatibacter sp.]
MMRPALPVATACRALAFAAVAAIAFQLLVLPEPAFAERIVEATWDKAVHAVVFGGVAFLLWAGFAGRGAVLVCALVILLGALDETRQMFVPGRDPDLHDLYADGLGAVAVLLFLEAVTSPRALPAAAPLTCGD